MTAPVPKLPPSFHAGIPERLAAEGRRPETVEAMLDFDGLLFHWHRAIARGQAVGELLAELQVGLDLAEFQALTAVTRITHGVGRAAPEPATIGALAEELAIDPSRASRLAAGLVARGLLRRELDQEDGRRGLLVVTEAAVEVLAQFRDKKWRRYQRIFKDWSDQDIRALAFLMRRYVEDSGLMPAPRD